MHDIIVRQGTTPGDGLTLAYREWAPRDGQRRRLPLLLLHGLTGSSMDWEPVARRLAADRRVIAFDARGHGASGWSAEAAYAGDAHFADLVMALDALDINRCILVGYSMGGGVAILTAGALPERVERLVVVDAYPAPEMTPGSRRIAEWVAASPYPLLPASALGSAGGRPPYDPAIARRIAEELASGQARRLDLWPLWEALRCPVLVVRGAWSDVLPPWLADEMLARQPLARLVTVACTGHQIPFAVPEHLATLITNFLADESPSGTQVWGDGEARPRTVYCPGHT